MGHYAGYMFTIADALVAMALLIKPGNKAGRKKASISEIIAGDSAVEKTVKVTPKKRRKMTPKS